MNPFEERLLETLFPDFLAWSNDFIATYMMHIPTLGKPIFFKKMTDDILDTAVNHEAFLTIYAIKTDGSVDDVTDAWRRVFDKQKSARKAVDELLEKWKAQVSSDDVATFEVKSDGVTLGYFPHPSPDILKTVERLRDLRRLTVLAIHKAGTIEDVTSTWKPMFEEYISIRFKQTE
jgi:hypothetical protein